MLKELWLGLAAAGCVCAQALSEQTVLDLFEQQSPLRRESQAAAAAAVEAVRGRTLWPNPVASYSREAAGFTEFVTGEQHIPWSGRLKIERQALGPARESAEAEGAARLRDMRSSVRGAFYRALAAQQQSDLIRAALTEIASILDLLRVREEEGEGSRYDRVRVEREAADLRADLALALAKAHSERSALAVFLPPQTRLDALAGTLEPLPVPAGDEVTRRALTARAEFRAFTARLAQLALEERSADRLRIPEPIVSGGLKRTQVLGNRNDTGVVFGVSIPLAVFNKGQTEVARLAAEQQRVQAQRDVLAQRIGAEIAGAHALYTDRLDAFRAFERETGGLDEDLVRIARVGFEEGEIGILQLLDAYRVRRQTQLRRLELLSSVKEIEIELSRSAGYEVTQ